MIKVVQQINKCLNVTVVAKIVLYALSYFTLNGESQKY